MRIKVPTFVIVITFLTGLIATILGAWAWLSPETFPGPSGVGAPTHTMLSWGARELAMALSSWIVIFVIKDARGYAVALGSALLRESLDFIDAFRIAARKICFEAPAARDCLWYTLQMADEIAVNQKEMDDEEEDA